VPDAPTRGVAAVIFDRDGRVLLIRENYDRKRWSLPGGTVEDGESLEEAAIRETLEETELVVEIEHLIGSYELDDGFTVAAFRCSILSGVPRVPSTDEIAEVEWWDSAELPEPKSNVLHYAVPDALGGHRDVIRAKLPRIN
jgi:8-oxo-dGTP diphosphatase